MNKQTKHTPGPWMVEIRDNEVQIWSVSVKARTLIRECVAILNGAYGETSCVGFSDARLIAAAPELLDALTDLVGGCGKEGDLFNSEAMEKARAAIAKATGEGV